MATAETFERFAATEARGSSPLYEALSEGVADDDALLALADEVPPDQPEPNLLFAAVQYLLLDSPEDPFAAYYPSVTASPKPPDEDVYPRFREFCLTHRDELLASFSARRVQTNVVRRSGVLYPVFEHLSRRCGRRPLGLLEVGASAGLNLLWDRYGYDYGEHGRVGDRQSPVHVATEIRGAHVPPLPDLPPAVGTRLGIDLNPLDVRAPDDVRWLRALVWPEHDDRRSLLEGAIAVARETPPTLVEGDAIETLAAAAERVPVDEQLCVFNTHTLYQLTPEQRDEFAEQVEVIGRERDLFWVDCEWCEDVPEVRLHAYVDGSEETTVLAEYDAHGRWIEWLSEERHR